VVGFAAAGAQLAALLLGHRGESVPATHQGAGIAGRWIVLSAPDWKTPPVLAATTFAERLAGMRAVPPGRGMLLWARTVHGWGLPGPIRLVRLDDAGTVAECRWLEPRRHVRWLQPAWTLELPSWHIWPPDGAKLRANVTLLPGLPGGTVPD
jgi:hypothetical protein